MTADATETALVLQRLSALLDRVEQAAPGNDDFDPDTAQAWRWRPHMLGGRLQPIRQFSDLRLADLHHIDHQKEELERNTRQFLTGRPANNALLWGPRGTGKSSLVKALFNACAGEGLRLIEVERTHLVDLPDIVALLDGFSHRFVVFCDDLSFDEHDSSYRALKVVLDGSILATPDNVLVYATSNRRHLVPERLRDNLDARHDESGEVHQSEAVEERISLSERFGLWLAFHPFNQERYLAIVDHWLQRLGGGTIAEDACRRASLQWAMLHGSRSGRTAYHFAKDWAGRQNSAP